MNKKTWTLDELLEACKTNYSLRGVLLALGLKPAGGNYATIKASVKDNKIDTAHWVGQGHLRGKNHSWTPSISLDSICVLDSTYNTNKLKKRLIKAGKLQARCSDAECSVIDTWNSKPIVLHLDHINGIRTDNRIENLRLLCPNCHSQTSTYCGRNKRAR